MLQAASKPSSAHQPLIIGWRERVDLPELGLMNLSAKIDTGARTSALHAEEIETFLRGGAAWVRFALPHAKGRPDRVLEWEIHDAREIKNTSGVPERRVIIRTTFVVGRRKWKIDVSLADHENMQYPLIVGRSALNVHHIAVDAGRSYLLRRSAKIPSVSQI
jgi:hypothetical protein